MRTLCVCVRVFDGAHVRVKSARIYYFMWEYIILFANSNNMFSPTIIIMLNICLGLGENLNPEYIVQIVQSFLWNFDIYGWAGFFIRFPIILCHFVITFQAESIKNS